MGTAVGGITTAAFVGEENCLPKVKSEWAPSASIAVTSVSAVKGECPGLGELVTRRLQKGCGSSPEDVHRPEGKAHGVPTEPARAPSCLYICDLRNV